MKLHVESAAVRVESHIERDDKDQPPVYVQCFEVNNVEGVLRQVVNYIGLPKTLELLGRGKVFEALRTCSFEGTVNNPEVRP